LTGSDTARVIVNANNQKVWLWDSAPFGDTAANEQPTGGLPNFTFNLRLPGQQYDRETGTHYNYFRDYEAGSGRYVQSDPVGLRAGMGTYGYTEGDPLSWFDPVGLGRRAAAPALPHKDLPEWKGGAGSGILNFRRGRYAISSSGAGSGMPNSLSGSAAQIASVHMEGRAAALMQPGETANLYINIPYGPCDYCKPNIGSMLPPGSRLNVHYPGGTGFFTSAGWNQVFPLGK